MCVRAHEANQRLVLHHYSSFSVFHSFFSLYFTSCSHLIPLWAAQVAYLHLPLLVFSLKIYLYISHMKVKFVSCGNRYIHEKAWRRVGSWCWSNENGSRTLAPGNNSQGRWWYFESSILHNSNNTLALLSNMKMKHFSYTCCRKNTL